jgi:hypothetical protein
MTAGDTPKHFFSGFLHLEVGELAGIRVYLAPTMPAAANQLFCSERYCWASFLCGFFYRSHSVVSEPYASKAKSHTRFSPLITVSPPVCARRATDVVVMNNGDRLTCTINRLENDVLYIGLSYADADVSMDRSKVARIESNQLFIIKTEDGSVFTGTIGTYRATSSDRAQLQVVEAGAYENR